MKKLSFMLVLLAPYFSTYAQKLEENQTPNQLEEVIIQGNRMEIPFTEASRDVQVITHKEISKMPANSINELLSYVSGVDIRQRGPFGGQADVSIDGGSFEQTLVLLNGIKLQDDQTAHIMMNIPLPMDAIDHIEVLRGAAARVYGANALTGAINIVTKKEATSFISTHIFGSSSFKSKEEGDGDGIYGGGGIEFTGNYGDENQNHLFSASQTSYNGQRYNTALNNTKVFYNGNYYFNNEHSIQALASYIDNKFGANGFYAAPGDVDSEEVDKTSLFSLSSKHRFGNLTLMPRVSNRYNTDDYRYFKHDLNTARSIHYTNAFMAELNANLSTDFGEFGIGWESRLSKINSSNIGRHQRDNHGAYIEYKTKFGANWIANAGIYTNYNTDYGWQTYPGIDVDYLINDQWKVSGSFGTAQRLPSFTDLYLNQAPGNVGNPNVEPEKAWQYEGTISYTGSSLKAKAGYFYRDISDFIDWVRPDDSVPYTPYNLGSNKMTGVFARIAQDFQLSGAHNFGYQISYNFLSPKMETDGAIQSKYVLENLKHQFVTGIHYSYANLSLQVQNRYYKRELNKAYDLLDIRAQYQFDAFDLYADVSNILDSEYREAGAVPMPPRWFSLGLKYRWNK